MEPEKCLLAVCSILILKILLPETRQKTNYMAVKEFIFPDGQPEAIVHWQIKSPYSEKFRLADLVFNKKHKVCFLNKLFVNVEVARENV